MSNRLKYYFLVSTIFLSSACSFLSAEAATFSSQLSGRILLQVESRGEAWYVNPQDNKKYYLGKPDDAYSLMKRLSLGISETEFSSWNKGAPAWAKGRLYIRPQSHGEAYYVDFNQRWHYLGRPNDAWLLFRAQGLGITNNDLNKIASASNIVTPIISKPPIISSGASDYVSNLSWSYNLEQYKLDLPLSSSLNSTYKKATKVFYYTGDVEPANSREQFYAIFFNKKSGDNVIKDLVSYGRKIAQEKSWTSDRTAEFLLALIQYIPYDSAKLNESPMQPNYPYETLYQDKGICSDKTFLAVAVLRELGYGAAILDFPNLNHSAAGISCPVTESINNSGYCYVETTNYFPIGVIPQAISSGQAVSGADSLSGLFDSSKLNKIEIYQKTSGLTYQGVLATKEKVSNLQTDKAWIESQKIVLAGKNDILSNEQATLSSQQAQLSAYSNSGNISSYNSLVGVYNAGVIKYNSDLESYKADLVTYNGRVNQYNQGLKSFYQQ